MHISKRVENSALKIIAGAGSNVALICSFFVVGSWAVSGFFVHFSERWAMIIQTLSSVFTIAQTKSLAIIVHDPDAAHPGGFTHWVAFNIDPAQDIPEGFQGGVQALNGCGKAGYTGPCPPSGTHHYHFMVYALDTKPDLPAQTDKAGLEKAMEGHILAAGDLVGLYKKGQM